MLTPLCRASLSVAVLCGGAITLSAQQGTPPPLRAAVDLITIDVQISPNRDAPFREFTTSDFEVRVSGKTRPVASATLLHRDTGAVRRPSDRTEPLPAATDAECAFAFRRTVDRPTVHYLLGVNAIDADRQAVKKVEVKVVDRAFDVQKFAWRSPIRKAGLENGHNTERRCQSLLSLLTPTLNRTTARGLNQFERCAIRKPACFLRT